jgi:hypothetical protein
LDAGTVAACHAKARIADGGVTLFKDLTAPLRFELVDAQTYTGAALHVYRPALA